MIKVLHSEVQAYFCTLKRGSLILPSPQFQMWNLAAMGSFPHKSSPSSFELKQYGMIIVGNFLLLL